MLRTLKSYAVYVRTLDLDDCVHHRLVMTGELPENLKKAREVIQGALIDTYGPSVTSEDFATWQVLGFVPEVTEMSDALWLKHCTHKEKGAPVFSIPETTLPAVLLKLGLDPEFNAIPAYLLNQAREKAKIDGPKAGLDLALQVIKAQADQTPEGNADQVPEGNADQVPEANADQAPDKGKRK